LGAVHSPAQRETLGERRPPAGSHECTNSRGRSTLRPYALGRAQHAAPLRPDRFRRSQTALGRAQHAAPLRSREGAARCAPTLSGGRSTLRPYDPIDFGVLKLLSGGRITLRPYDPIDSGVLKLLSGGRSTLRPYDPIVPTTWNRSWLATELASPRALLLSACCAHAAGIQKQQTRSQAIELDHQSQIDSRTRPRGKEGSGGFASTSGVDRRPALLRRCGFRRPERRPHPPSSRREGL